LKFANGRADGGKDDGSFHKCGEPPRARQALV
jgi:hypothetical protein